MPVQYVDLPVSLRGTPGALASFRVRSVIDPWEVFLYLAAATTVLLAVGWARRLIGAMGPS